MNSWQLIKTPRLSGRQNMEYDLKLFHDFEKGLIPSTLRIYSWKPNCISLGYSQKMDRLIDGKMARKKGWDVVKRPTGGGIVFHNEAEVTYSLVMAIDDPILPEGLVPSYIKISEAIVYGLKMLGVVAEIQGKGNWEMGNGKWEMEYRNNSSRFAGSRNTLYKFNKEAGQFPISNSHSLCFSYPADYEIVCNGKKIIGSAQKRGKRALLQQGSIFVRETPAEISQVLKKSYQKQSAVSVEEVIGRGVSFSEICQALTEGFEACFGISFIRSDCDKMQVV